MIQLIFIILFAFSFLKIFSSQMDDHAFKQADQALKNQQNSIHANIESFNQVQNQPEPASFSLPDIFDDIPFEFFYAKDIVLEGDEVLSRFEKKRLFKPYIKKKLRAKDAQDLLRDCRNLYLKKGFITTRVWIPSQDPSSSTLQLRVQMGRVSSMRMSNQKGWLIKHAILFKKDDILNIRDIEQSLANLNRLSSQSYQVFLLPDASIVGASIVQLVNQEASTISGLLSYTEPPSKSWYPDQLLLSFDQLLGIQDQWHLSLSQQTTAVHQYLLSGVSISLPFKRILLTSALRFFKHASLMKSSGQRYFHYFNHYQMASFALKWQCFAWPKASLQSKLSYQKKQKNRYLENTFLVHQHQILDVLDSGLLFTWRSIWGELNLHPQYRMGRMLFPSIQQAQSPLARFSIWHGSVSYQGVFHVFKQSIGYQLFGYGFFSKRQLNATEQFSLGDQYSVRGFDGFIQGDKGYRSKIAIFKRFHPLLNPKLLIEGGEVFDIQQSNKSSFVLSGVFENSLQIKNIALNMSYSKALLLSENLNKEGQFAFRADIRF